MMSSIAHSTQATTSSSSSTSSESRCLSPASPLHSSMHVPNAADDPAVIVGLACRVPGAQNPSQLWKLIVEQRDVQRKVPEDRFNVDAFYHPDGTNKGTTNAKYGYFLDQDIGLFDAGFFNISGKEAEAMDPQQRLLLEVVYEALENAGIALDSISGSHTSVFCGCFTNDYNAMTTKDLQSYPKYTVTGTGNSILANRISYFYNLHGPSATIDTACSSSLVCFHMGNQSIRNKESDLSIVVGSALHFDPNIFITMTDLGMLSTDGRCRAFDASGRGYVRGEGVCAAILKRQSQAELDGDTIRAVVRGTAVNHDGRKQGITLPSSEAQEKLIRKTYRIADIDPAHTQYFEAHGTGTAAGDPRETRAIGAVFSTDREQALSVGSVKTNIGHLEGASGLAGIIKATLSLENKKIPPNMHFSSPNPSIKFEDWKISVPTKMRDWPSPNELRRASINSFGYGGTNAHVILEGHYDSKQLEESLPTLPEEFAEMVRGRPFMVPLSSHSEKAGKLLIRSLIGYLEQHSDTLAQDLAYSLSVRRSMHKHRSFVIGKNTEIMLKELETPPPVAAWTPASEVKPRLGFIMTGQGGQWFAMGRQLIEQSPLFRQTLHRCDEILQRLPDSPEWSVTQELLRSKETSNLAKTRFSQPICTALQLAILELLVQWGVKPSAVIGHSSGEMAAAYAAGILSFENAIIAAYYRGLYMSNGAEGVDSRPGAMMAVGITEAEAVTEIKPYEGRIAIAAINSPSSMTLSGDEDAIIDLKGRLTERKIFARQLQVAQAFHSHHMYPLAAGYQKALNHHPGFTAQEARLRMFSSVTARIADPSKMYASYWTANMTGTVRFSDALTGIVLDDQDEQNVDILIEIGPHPALKGPSRQVVQSLKLDIPYLASLTRGIPDYEGLLGMAASLYMHGYPVDLVALNSDHFIGNNNQIFAVRTGQKLNALPSYAWDHARYWAETRLIREHRLRTDRHAILGVPVPGSIGSHPRWRNYLRLSELPWLSEHVIDGKIVFPAAGYISMAIEAKVRQAANAMDIKNIVLRDVSIRSALTLTDKDAGTEVVLELRPVLISAKNTSDSWHEFVICAFDVSGRSTEHCRGLISAEQGLPASIKRVRPYPSLSALEKDSNRRILVQNYYQCLDSLGLQYGESFKLLSGDIESGPGFAFAPLSFRPYQISAEPADIFVLHPTFLDASVHVIFAAIESRMDRPLDEPFIPTFLRSMTVSGSFISAKAVSQDRNFQVCTDTTLSSPRVAMSDIRVHPHGGEELLIDMQGLQLTALGNDAADTGSGRSLFFRIRWQPSFDLLGCRDRPLPVDGIAQIMDLFAHQHPNCHILHFTSDIESSKEALRLLGGRDGERHRFKSYTPYAACLDGFQEILDTWTGLINIEEPKEGSYDLVVVDGEIDDSVEAYVKPGGYVISNGLDTHCKNLTPLFSGSGFSAGHRSLEESSVAGPLTLVLAAAASDRTKTIASSIRTAYSGIVSTVSLAQLAEQTDFSENIIVLSSLDEDLFFAESSHGSVDYHSVQKLLTQQQKNVVWLLEGATMDSRKPEHAIISGLARSARSENDRLRLVILDIAEASEDHRVPQLLMQVLDPKVKEDEIAERNGTLFIPRVEADDLPNSKLPKGLNGEPKIQQFVQERPLALKIGRVGLLETLVFADDEKLLDSSLEDDDLEIEVRASAINFRDIAASMGIIEDEKLGDECSGVVIQTGSNVKGFEVGDRVVAWRPGQGAHCSIVRNPASLCYKLGEMSFTVAAAMPLILTTAYYALMDVARVQPGESVLIHSAAGGVGQMAIQIAQNIGASVIATVGSQAKREILKTKYLLTDDQIFSSRDDSFVGDIMRVTQGKGVDVVLNSLSGKLLHATWGCVAPFGRFVEIGKRDIHENSKLPMDPFRVNVTFASVDLVTIFERNKPLGARVFQDCCKLVHERTIQPPETIIELSYTEVEKGFRLLQMGKHTGKVVLVPTMEDKVPVLPSKFRNTRLFSSSKVYLLVGGLGGLGRTLAEWMVRKGAKNLAFLSRSGADKAEAQATIGWLRARKVQTSVYHGDVTNYLDVEACIASCGHRLAGIFQAAMILQDAPLDQMTYKQWETCVRPKVQGTYNLHTATLQIQLDFFICLSSVSSILGSKAQSNYSAANSYIDALMRQRREMRFKGTTINCGMIVGVGAVAENATLQKIMERTGYDPVNEQELLYQIEEAVIADNSETSSDRGFDQHQTITGINLQRQGLFWAEKPLFRNLYANNDINGEATQTTTNKSLGARLRSVTNSEERNSLLTTAFIEKVAAVLAVASETIQPKNPLSAYGLDSIVAVEFRKWFSKSVGVDLGLFDVLGSTSINALVTKAAGMIKTDESKSEGDGDTKGSVTNKSGNGEVPMPRQDLSGEIVSANVLSEIPMSTFQRRLWFVHNLSQDKSLLNLPVIFHLKGQPDFSALQQALREMKIRNKILRTSYFEGENFGEQKPLDDIDLQLDYQDLSSKESPRTSLDCLVTSVCRQELNIERGEVLKVALAKLDITEHALVLVFHHIAIDRGSSKSFLSQLTSIYDGIRGQKDLSLIASPTIQYLDFSIWHNAHLQSSMLDLDIRFWKEKLTGASGPSKLLPFARSERPTQNDYKRAVHKATLETRTLGRMKRICSRMGMTPFQFLLTAFRCFLYRYTEERDLTILMIKGDRPHPDLDDVLGFFVNMIPLRCVSDCDAGFDSLLEQMKNVVLEAMEHSKVPFDVIADAVKVEKDPSYFPLGQIVLNYQIHGKMPHYPTQDFDIYDVISDDIPSACELNLEAMEDPTKGLDLRLEYSTTLYNSKDMSRFFDNFLTFFTSVIKDYRQPIAEIEMCGQEEIQHLRQNYWATNFSENTWSSMSVLEKVFEHAKLYPRTVAIRTSDEDSIIYEDLVRQAQSIAFSLRRRGAVPGQYVGLFSRPGIEAIAGMIAILLIRCGYVPMDPDFSPDRLAFMASDSKSLMILFGQGLEAAATEIALKTGQGTQAIGIAEAASSESKLRLLKSASPNDPFYMIYTSGSTGKPKGVVLTQSNTQQMLSTLHHDYKFVARDRFLHHSSICFDLSVVQIFSALTAGATIYIASAIVRKDPSSLASFMQQSSVTVTYFTPSQFALLLEYARESLQRCIDYRIAFFAGERLPVRVVKAFYDLQTPATLYNTWSPSELVVQTTIHEATYPDAECFSIPIGRPIANCRHYIVDSRLNPLPAGLIGELCVGGAQVGAGYLNRPEANAKSFLDNPFAEAGDRNRGWIRLFRTGDKGRFRPDGQIEFHGRIAGDKQIKLRGYRIDLGEVEQRLFLESSTEEGNGIVDLSVVARASNTSENNTDVETIGDRSSLTDDRKLVAFIVPRQPLDARQKQTLVTSIHEKIGVHLNTYMLPNGYQFLEQLPVTIGGKVDRQNLLSRDLDLVLPSAVEPLQISDERSIRGSVNTKVMQSITDIFREVLNLPKVRQVATTDTFFALGGQSILLLRLQSRLKRAFKVTVSVNELYKAPTPAGVYDTICSISGTENNGRDDTKAANQKVSWSEEVTLPSESRYKTPYGARGLSRADVTKICLTGVDSFIGVHMLESLLSARDSTTIYLLGTQQRLVRPILVEYFQKYKLFSTTITDETLDSRVHYIPGTLTEPHFGLDNGTFVALGEKIQAIYHLGGQTSLLKTYTDLKQLNVSAALDIIELAACGKNLTEIHHLSTWSVPHLQTWFSTKRTKGSILTSETDPTHFSPPASDEFGYFKSRWVSEMLMTQASQRGFPVSIYRASAVTASTYTKVPEPAEDFIPRMILRMIECGCTPKIRRTDPQFAVDFIPVDYLVSTMYRLSTTDIRNQDLSIYHVGNPKPLLLSTLPRLMGDVRNDHTVGRSVAVDEWFDLAAKSSNKDDQLRWAVLKDYLTMGHVMFALDRAETDEKIRVVGGDARCPPVDAEYLRRMWEMKVKAV